MQEGISNFYLLVPPPLAVEQLAAGRKAFPVFHIIFRVGSLLFVILTGRVLRDQIELTT